MTLEGAIFLTGIALAFLLGYLVCYIAYGPPPRLRGES